MKPVKGKHTQKIREKIAHVNEYVVYFPFLVHIQGCFVGKIIGTSWMIKIFHFTFCFDERDGKAILHQISCLPYLSYISRITEIDWGSILYCVSDFQMSWSTALCSQVLSFNYFDEQKEIFDLYKPPLRF